MSLSSAQFQANPVHQPFYILIRKALGPLVLLLIILSGYSSAVHGLSMAPEFTLTDIDATSYALSDFRGQVVILEFFTVLFSD